MDILKVKVAAAIAIGLALVLGALSGCTQGMLTIPMPAEGCQYMIRNERAGSYFQEAGKEYINQQVDPLERFRRDGK